MAMALSGFALCAGAQDFSQVACRYHGVVTARVASQEYLWTADKTEDDGLLNVSVYDSNIKPVCSIKSADPIIPFGYVNYTSDRYLCPISRGFFGNDDTKFEYITGIYGGEEDSGPTGVVIKQEDGTILATINFGDGCSMPHTYMADYDGLTIEVLLFDEKYFLCFQLYTPSTTPDGSRLRVIRLYEFDRGHISTSLKKVADLPTKMKVSPTLPQKNETIKVDLSGMSSPNKLSVVDTNGKVCFTQALHVGQESVELSTNGMPAGMYIIRVSDGSKEVENCRVIIR